MQRGIHLFLIKCRRSALLSVSVFVILFLLMLPENAGAQTAHFAGTQSLGGGFTYLTSVAVDRNGNVFVADSQDGSNNTVKEIPPGCFSASCVKTLVSSFIGPNGGGTVAGLAIDGIGNVFASNSGGVVYEIMAEGGSIPATPTINTLGSGFISPVGLAVDGSGNVFVADYGNGAVKEIPSGCIAPTCVTANTVASGFNGPNNGSVTGVAVDGNGNIFIANSGYDAVKEIVAVNGSIPASPTIKTLGGTFNQYPFAVAVDGSGNVFVTSFYDGKVYEIPPGCINSDCVRLVGEGFNHPEGVAVDGKANIFIADSLNGRVVKLETGDFGTVAIGQTSATISLTFSFDSAGTIGTPLVLTMGAAGLDFADAGTGTCTTNGTSHTYSTGDTCTVDVRFTPIFAGSRSGGVVLTSSSGTPIANAYIHGIGSGPQVSFLPGSQSTLASFAAETSWTSGVAIDGNGNVYATDYDRWGDGQAQLVKLTPSASGYSQSVIPTSTMSGPYGVAVDGSGSIYVTDTDHFRVLKETPSAGGYVESTVASFAPVAGTAPIGVAVDGSGNVYISCSEGTVYKETPTVGGYSQSTVDSNLPSATGIAVDGNGNVYVAVNETNGWIVKEAPSANGYVQSTIPVSGDGVPFGVAVDGSGSVYISFIGSDDNGKVFKEAATANGYIQTTIPTSGLNQPMGIAVDGGGNVYIADSYNSRVVKEDLADAPSLNFGSVNVGMSSAEHTVTLQNIGNAPLNFPVLSSGSNPSITSTFILGSSGATECPLTSANSIAGTLAAGASCSLSISFDPTVTGDTTGSLVITDDALNAASPTYATQTIALQGHGLPSETTTTLSVPSSVMLGEPVTLTATVNPAVATGTVTFRNGSTILGSATLSSGTATLTSAATTANGFAVGSNSVVGVYSGDNNDLGSTSDSATLMVTVGTTTTVTTSPSSVPLGSAASLPSLTATVSSNGGTPLGTVTFKVGSIAVGSAALSNGSATLSGVSPTSANGFTVGSDNITAIYNPASGSGFIASSGTQTLTVTAPAYTITPSSTTVALSKGGSRSVTLTFASTTFADATTWTASASSSLIAVTPSSGTVNLSANGSSTVNLTIAASSSAANHTPRLPWTGELMVFGTVLVGVPLARRKRVLAVTMTALAIATLGLLMSCGGGGGSSSIPPRSYTVTISGTGGISSTIAVTVQ